MCDQADIMWQHTWASAEILSEFIATNPALWKGKTVMELGAGVAALPSMTALRCGAAKVIITEQSRLEKAFEFIRRNLERNFDTVEIDKRVQMIGFDWHAPEESIVGLCQNGSELQVDYLLGSDIFYDPSVFDMLINTLDRLFSRFPNMEFYFAYQIRDSDWTIEQQLLSNGLRCSLVRCVDTTQHSICIGKIYKLLTANGTLSADHKILENMDTTTISSEVIYYAGIEGGATHSTLVLIDSSGNRVGQWDDGPGLNCLLNGVERTADQIAKWVREAMLSASKAPAELIRLPIASLGMGLSGAEDESTNNRMLDYLREQHGDLAEIYFLTSDSVAAVATSFEKGGVVLIAGTGSACRILKSNGDVHGVGGWGHLIGDGGSAFWITMRAIRRIFDVEDGFGVEEELRESEMETIATVKQALLHHFNVTSKLALLDILYNPHFSKSPIASFCRPLAKLAEKGDTFAAELFQNAGHILGQHLTTIARHFDDEMFTNEVPVILIGSVFKSWAFLRGGFQKSLNDYNAKKVNEKGKCIRVVTFYQLECSSAIGAAILGSKQGIKGLDNSLVKKLQSRKLFDKITF